LGVDLWHVDQETHFVGAANDEDAKAFADGWISHKNRNASWLRDESFHFHSLVQQEEPYNDAE
jgi:hypothetical protein